MNAVKQSRVNMLFIETDSLIYLLFLFISSCTSAFQFGIPFPLAEKLLSPPFVPIFLNILIFILKIISIIPITGLLMRLFLLAFPSLFKRM